MVDVSQQELQMASEQTRWWKRKKPLAVAAGAAIVLIALLLYLHWHNTGPTSEQISLAQHQGKYQEAISLTKKALDKTKTNDKQKLTALNVILGNNYLNNKQPELAIQAYKTAAKTGGMTSNLAYLIASTYQGMHDNDNAISYYKQAIKLWPTTDPLYRAETDAIKDNINTLQNSTSNQ
jgi:tetratricopeptide (TPR) repeat protein